MVRTARVGLPTVMVGFAILLSSVRPANAQGAADLKPGRTVVVTDRQGVQIEGRVARASSEQLVLLVDKAERPISTTMIGRIEKRDPLWNGMLIGAAPLALVGAAAGGASCTPHCSRDVTLAALELGAMGAGLGALIDWRVHGYSIVAGPHLPSANAIGGLPPAASLQQLWTRVRQGDTIRVTTYDNETVSGRFVKVTETTLRMVIEGRDREIPSREVREVTRKGNRYRYGAATGAVVFGALGMIGSASCSGGGCGNPLFTGMFMGSAGALWGAAIGAAIPRHQVAYGADAAGDLRVMPTATSGRIGLAIAMTF